MPRPHFFFLFSSVCVFPAIPPKNIITPRDRRTPGEPRRVSSRGWRCIPAPFRRNPTNHDKFPAKPATKCRNIFAKSGPGATPETPKLVRDAPGTRRSEENVKKSEKCGQKISVKLFGGGFLAILGSGRDPKIDKKRAR